MKLQKEDIGFFLLLLLTFWSCNKIDVPEPVEEAPIFFTDLQAGDQNLNFSAGRDNYLMEANFRIDPNNQTLDLIGIIRPADCNSRLCPGSVRISLRDQSPFDRTNFSIDEVFSTKQFDYAWNVNRDSALVTFKPHVALNDITNITWMFADSKEVHNQKEVRRILKSDQDYQVKLEISQRSCKSSQTQTINLLQGGCRSVIAIQNRKAQVRSTGTAPFKYQWSDGTQDSTIELAVLTAVDMREFAVTVTDSRGCVSEATLGITPGASNDAICRSDFEYVHQFLDNPDKTQFGTALIEVINAEGKIFRSDRFKQPDAANFQILEVSDFQSNERGQKTKKLKIQLASLLSSNLDPSEQIKLNGQCVIAVAYPD